MQYSCGCFLLDVSPINAQDVLNPPPQQFLTSRTRGSMQGFENMMLFVSKGPGILIYCPSGVESTSACGAVYC